MIDYAREDVINALEYLLSPVCTETQFDYCDEIRAAIAMLREQDEGIVPIESTTEQKKFADRIGIAVSDFWCGACHFNLVGHPKFCPNCGKKVKWSD